MNDFVKAHVAYDQEKKEIIYRVLWEETRFDAGLLTSEQMPDDVAQDIAEFAATVVRRAVMDALKGASISTEVAHDARVRHYSLVNDEELALAFKELSEYLLTSDNEVFVEELAVVRQEMENRENG